MMINTSTGIPVSVANQNFSGVARMADGNGSAVSGKDHPPHSQMEDDRTASVEETDALAQQILSENDDVFRELAR